MKKLLLLLLIGLPAVAAPPRPARLRHFVLDLLNEQVPDSVLIARHMCPDLLLRHGDARLAKARAGLHSWRLSYQQLSPQRVRRLRVLPSRSALHPDFHLLGGQKNTYVVQLKGRLNLYLLADDNQVNSFLLLDQGGEAYFLDFCH